jgi:Xaa-Pro aminopeptidase
MNHIGQLQDWLRTTQLSGFVLPTTDEFLSEFPPPANRRLQWATGFRGSTGVAVILRNAAALFLDGRYLLQARDDVDMSVIALEPAALPAWQAWLKRSLPANARLGFDPWLHSATEMQQHWQGLATETGFELERLAFNPVDELWKRGRPPEHRPSIVDYPLPHAGASYQTKCAALVEHLNAIGLKALLVADPEDVSWLLNVRAGDEALQTEVGDWHIVPAATSRVLVRCDGTVTWFVDPSRLSPVLLARDRALVTLGTPESIASVLREMADRGPVGLDPRRAPVALTAIVEATGEWRADDSVARGRWRKHRSEQDSARHAHIVDAAAVVRFMAWLKREVGQRPVGELEAARSLESYRAENRAYKGPSMPLMSASGASGAQPHYVPRAGRDRMLNEHPIFWMDSGGQYAGGTTDNTFVLAVGEPQPRHVFAHTTVLRANIALATARVPVGCYALHLDLIARQVLWREGMDFGHGTGHGVGNFLNIHEGPLLGREPMPFTMVRIEPGMIMTNEPGYYARDDFGVRIESHMIVVPSSIPDFLEFDTISRLPVDPALVDFQRLSREERRWLARYHRTVLRDLEPLLDAPSLQWLRALVDPFLKVDVLPHDP